MSNWHIKNRKKHCENSKRYYQEHREVEKAQSKEYYHTHKKEISAKNKDRYERTKNDPDKIAKRKLWRLNRKAKIWAERRTVDSRYSTAKSICKKLKREFGFSLDEYTALIGNNCTYCGLSLQNETGVGLDRKDNSKGYTKDNVLPCCGLCNRIRSDVFSIEEMEILGQHIRSILDERKNNGGKK